MSFFVRIFASVALIASWAITTAPARAQDNTPVQVSSGVSYQFIGRWSADKLNQILKTETPKFFGVDVTYTPATNAVKLYRITYDSVIPEQGNRPTVASGLPVT